MSWADRRPCNTAQYRPDPGSGAAIGTISSMLCFRDVSDDGAIFTTLIQPGWPDRAAHRATGFDARLSTVVSRRRIARLRPY
jgi:hypothetical protein